MKEINAYYQPDTKPIQILVKYAYRNTTDERLLSFLHQHPVAKPTKINKKGIVNFSVYSKTDKQVMFINQFENTLNDESSKAVVTKTLNKLWKLIDGLTPANLQHQMTDAEADADLE